MTIPTNIKPLQLRAVLGRKTWTPPAPFGPDGFVLDTVPDHHERGRVIVSQSPLQPDMTPGNTRWDATDWIHASMSWNGRVATYDELMLLKRAVWGDSGEAYQIHPAADRHVNLHPFTLHLWGRADGARVLPDFGYAGTI